MHQRVVGVPNLFGPIVIYEQFKFFFDLYFLLVALFQFAPAFRTGALFRSDILIPPFLHPQ
ncbi:hypothetical protein F5888DRAFT_1703572 [Russula emetica]|nr:hypothetical protein F5888DRAFT_1703572 [Russula emetica]